jgi:DNA polymerase-3 subunit alpha
MVTFDLPEMQEILEETYGITVYQEQVMLLSQKLAGFSKGQADILRKAMGKKDKKTLDKMKGSFLEGAIAKGHPKDKLEKIWTDWEAFAQYAFNKSHSTCYALVAYQTAYLKAHHPNEFMAALLNHAGSIDKITFFMEECKRMGLNVLGPDINESGNGFAVNAQGEIRFGFSGIKGVGEAAIECIIEERNKRGPYKDIFDLAKRVNLRTVNKRSLESLVYSGAFDYFPELHRAQYLYQPDGDSSMLDKIIRYGGVTQTESGSNANTLFGDMEMPEIAKPKLVPCEPWDLLTQLEKEKEAIGIYISGHPLDNYRFELKYYNFTSLLNFNEIKISCEANGQTSPVMRMAGLVTEANHRVSKTGKKFGVLTIEDYSGNSEFLLWGEDYVRYNHYLTVGTILMLEGAFRQRFNNGKSTFGINKIHLLETVKTSMTKQIQIEVQPQFVDEALVNFMEKNIREHPGNTGIKFHISDAETDTRFSLFSMGQGFSLNDEMTEFLSKNNHLQVSVLTG